MYRELYILAIFYTRVSIQSIYIIYKYNISTNDKVYYIDAIRALQWPCYSICVVIYIYRTYEIIYITMTRMCYIYRSCEAYTNILGFTNIYIILGGEKRFKSSKSGKNKKIRNLNAILIILKWSYTPLNNLEPRAYLGHTQSATIIPTSLA